jgi:hypothetical protein
VTHLRVLGCTSYRHISKDDKKKFDDKSSCVSSLDTVKPTKHIVYELKSKKVQVSGDTTLKRELKTLISTSCRYYLTQERKLKNNQGRGRIQVRLPVIIQNLVQVRVQKWKFQKKFLLKRIIKMVLETNL